MHPLTSSEKAELEGLAQRQLDLAAIGVEIATHGDAWIATARHVHEFGNGRGVLAAAVAGDLIDRPYVELVPEKLRRRLTADDLDELQVELEKATRRALQRSESNPLVSRSRETLQASMRAAATRLEDAIVRMPTTTAPTARPREARPRRRRATGRRASKRGPPSPDDEPDEPEPPGSRRREGSS